MKKILLAFVLMIATGGLSTSNAQETEREKETINWMTLEEAVEAQKKAPKKILIDAYTKWCGPCKMLDRDTFSNEYVATYINANFYAVKFNAEGNEDITYKGNIFKNPNYDPAKATKRNSAHQLSSYFGIRAYPTIIYIDENNELIAPIAGFQDVKGIEFYLKLFGTDSFRNIKTEADFTSYKDNFKYEFKTE